MQNLPNHVFIIPDGNGRWAEKYGKFRSEGHGEGAKRFREIAGTAFEMGIRYFTFWAASASNLRERSLAEVQVLVSLLRQELEKKSTLEKCLKNKTRFGVIGNWFEILPDTRLLHTIQALQEQTKVCDRHFLTILFGYSGVEDMVEIARNICKHRPRHIDPETVRRASLAHMLPPVDLVIRTGSERPGWTHVSDGILNPWLTPNSQIYYPQVLWPAFTEEEFRKAIADYSETPRRFGA